MSSHITHRPSRNSLVARIADLEAQVERLAARLDVEREARPALSPEHVTALVGRFRAESDAAARRAVTMDRRARALPDGLYLDLENEFRGGSDDVRRSQTVYLPDIRSVEDAAPVADLGAGRGEWLRLLRDEGIVAFGVDSDPSMVDVARDQDIDVRHAELMEFVESAAPDSLRAITMFHVVEHLELADLFAVLGHAHRALVPGGVLIAETPNISNLAVAASGFWIDPTHVRPLHPELLRFLVLSAGFESAEPRFLHPVMDPPAVRHRDDRYDAVVRQMVAHIYGSQDFAVIARKAG
ncbi:MAG: class I SAM-dependent methyltransferase [Ilumatobacteraceae bacterium]